MTKQPEIKHKTSSAHELTAELIIPDDLSYTEGHFDDAPIVPGVVLIDWALDQAMHSFADLGSVDEINQVKFQKPLQPGDHCTLHLQWNPEKNKLSFEYTEYDTSFANGWCTTQSTRPDQ